MCSLTQTERERERERERKREREREGEREGESEREGERECVLYVCQVPRKGRGGNRNGGDGTLAQGS